MEPVGNPTYVRWVRAAVLTLLVVASTLAAHVTGGGVLPDPTMLLPVCALATLASAAVLRRPLSWWWSAIVLLAGQTALHGALQLLPATATATATGTSGGTAGMAGHAARAAPSHLGVDPGVTTLRALTEWSGDARMVGAHVGAAVLVGAWLAAGERAIRSVLALAAGSTRKAWLRLLHVLLTPLTPTFALARRRPAPRVAAAVPSKSRCAGSGATRRGPPTDGRAHLLWTGRLWRVERGCGAT
ncbi:hypothetical protein GCM10027039_20500 [Terrabacter koreensis]